MKDKEYYKARKQVCQSNLMYSIQRTDLLIISISGAGVYVILEVLKFGYNKNLGNTGILKTAGLLFIFSIILNLFSQSTGRRANHHDILFCDAHIEADDTPSEEQLAKISHHDCRSEIYSKWTHRLDKFSIIALAIGLCFVISYFLINL